MSHNAIDVDESVNNLIRKCADSCLRGRSRAAPILNPDEKINLQFLLAMLPRISLSEIGAILLASQLRARALAFSRAGDHSQAQYALDLAKKACAKAALSKEAEIADQSFQDAAVSFVQYKTGDYKQAEASLLAALDRCRTLRDQYGYAVDVRRIHLVRNVVRVRSFDGRREDAFGLACLTMRYLEGDTGCWPFPELQSSTEPDVLATEDRLILFDQILSEISWLLTHSVGGDSLLGRADPALFAEHGNPDGSVSRARVRLSTIRAVAQRDLRGFLANATVFLWDGPGYMPKAWRETRLEFIQMCRHVAPETIASLDED